MHTTQKDPSRKEPTGSCGHSLIQGPDGQHAEQLHMGKQVSVGSLGTLRWMAVPALKILELKSGLQSSSHGGLSSGVAS